MDQQRARDPHHRDSQKAGKPALARHCRAAHLADHVAQAYQVGQRAPTGLKPLRQRAQTIAAVRTAGWKGVRHGFYQWGGAHGARRMQARRHALQTKGGRPTGRSGRAGRPQQQPHRPRGARPGQGRSPSSGTPSVSAQRKTMKATSFRVLNDDEPVFTGDDSTFNCICTVAPARAVAARRLFAGFSPIRAAAGQIHGGAGRVSRSYRPESGARWYRYSAIPAADCSHTAHDRKAAPTAPRSGSPSGRYRRSRCYRGSRHSRRPTA